MRKINKAIFNKWILDVISDYSHRIEVYYGGGGSGKSYGAMQKVLLKAMNSKRRVLVIRKVGNTLKDSIFALTLKLLQESGLYDYCKINKSDYTITLPNGSEFLFKGLDDPEKIKSIDGVTDEVIEEATELSLDDFTQLNIRLRPECEHPQIYLMFNPISKANWVYDNLIVNTPDNAMVIHTTYTDNKFLREEYKEELEKLKERNPAYYRIYCLGEFATLDKLVYPKYTKRIISEEEIAGLKKYIGADFGYINDPSAIVWGYLDKVNLKIYIIGEFVKKGMLNDEIANVMINLGLAKDKSYGDCAERKSIDEIKQKGVNMDATEKGKDSVIHGIQWIQQFEIIVDERCTHVIEELENYTWQKDKKTGEYINVPIDAFNHCLDALRYGLNKDIKGTLQPKIYVKPQFI